MNNVPRPDARTKPTRPARCRKCGARLSGTDVKHGVTICIPECPPRPCERCDGERGPRAYRLTATDLNGNVLHTDEACRACAEDAGFVLGK